MSSRVRFLIAIAALFGAASGWAADQGGAPIKGQFYIHPEFVWYDPPGKLGYDDSATAPGIVLGLQFLDNWAMEGQFYRVDPDLKDPVGGSGQVDSWAANVVYNLPSLTSWFHPFVTIGGGRGDYDRDAWGKTSTQNEYNFGAGFYLFDSKRFAFRADVRGIYLNDAEKLQPFAAAGLVLKVGRIEEKAPPPPPAAAPVDSDGDGVPDTTDQCPGTPKGVKVDSVGCPLDSDGDGVPDYLDKCPDTPRGTKVDANGCPIPVAMTFNLTVEFAFNSAEINDLAFRELRNAMTFMREHPDENVIVEGHTDNIGSAAFNMKLSERRAAAVKDVLVKSGIDGSRITTVGYGLTRPIASNDTEEGRAKNRRVSIVVK